MVPAACEDGGGRHQDPQGAVEQAVSQSIQFQALVQDDAVHKAAHPHPEKERRRFRGRPG